MHPIVLHPITLPDLLQYLLDHRAPPTNLIICSSREAFEQQLLAALNPPASINTTTNDAPQPDQSTSTHPLLTPTLHHLTTASTITLSFTPTLPSLRAHLSLLSTTPAAPSPSPNPARHPTLALLNPLALHSDTTAFSAQGLSRTLAAAVDAARARGGCLVVAECAELSPRLLLLRRAGRARGVRGGGDEDEQGDEQEDGQGDEREDEREDERDEQGVEGDGGVEGLGPQEPRREQLERSDAEPAARRQAAPDPWAEELSMLNVTTKSFGVGGRGWAGRTVTARRVAEQWFGFVDLAARKDVGGGGR